MDRVFALVGLVGAVAGAQALGKIPKVARGLEKLGRMGHRITPARVESMYHRIAGALSGAETAAAAERHADEAADVTRAVAEGSAGVDRVAKREPLEARLPAIVRNAELPDAERILEAERLLGRSIPTEQRQAILAVHDAVSKGVFQNDASDLRAMRQLLTGKLPEAKKAELKAKLEAKNYNPAIIDNVAKKPMEPEEVDTLIAYGILGKPGNIVAQLADMARGADGNARLVRFARAANDNNKQVSEIRGVIEEAYRQSGMDADTARDMAVYVTARSRLVDGASVAETAAAVLLSLDKSAPVSVPHIDRVLRRFVADGLIAETDVSKIGMAVVTELRRLGTQIGAPAARAADAARTAERAPVAELSPEDLARGLRVSGADAPEAVRAVRTALTDTRIPAAKAVETLLAACGTHAYDSLAGAIQAIDHYPMGRKNALLDALGARLLRSGMERAGADGEARMRAVAEVFGQTPDPTRLRGALDELRSQGAISHPVVSDVLGRLQRGEDLLRNRRGLETLQTFRDGVSRYGVASIEECFDATKPLSIDGQTVSADTIRGLLDGSLAAPDPLRTKRIVAELEARTPLGHMRAMLRDNGLSVTRELLGGGNLRTDTRIYAIADINAALKGEGGLSPREFEALEAALKTRVDEARMRRSHELMARPEAEKAVDAAVDAARKIREEIGQRFNMDGMGAGQRIVFVPETPQEMNEATEFFRRMRQELYAAVARGEDGRIRTTPEGKPLLEFDRARFRSGSESSDAMRQWVEAWQANFAETMRYLETTVSKYTDGVRMNARLERAGIDSEEAGRIDLSKVLTIAERQNLMKLTDNFAQVVSDFIEMARTNKFMLPEETTSMVTQMRRELWALRLQLGAPEKFERIASKTAEVRNVYNSLPDQFRHAFGDDERAAVMDYAMRLDRAGQSIADIPTNRIVNELFLRPLMEAAAAARRAA